MTEKEYTGRWYDKSAEEVCHRLKSDPANGLTRREASRRLGYFGRNSIYPVPKGSFYSYLKHIITDFTSILLIVTALIAVVFEASISAAVIVAMLLANYIIAIFTYVKAQRVLEGMGHFALPTAKVMRDGKLYMVKEEQLARGDIIFVNAGDIVPADVRLIESEGLAALEVNLTGRPRSVEKDAEYIDPRVLAPEEQKNMLFASTILTAGSGKAVVCEVGERTLVSRLGKNRPVVSHEKLGILRTLQGYCGFFSLAMIGVIFVLTLISFFVSAGERGLFDIFMTGLALAVASMSELYTAFGYIIIACGIFNAVNQYKDINSGALIKNSAKLEKLKDITCLIVPKDGAFTVKDLRVERIMTDGDDGAEWYSVSDKRLGRRCTEIIRAALISTGIYGGARLVADNMDKNNIRTSEEDALILLAEKYGLYNLELERDFPMIDHIGVTADSRFETTLYRHRGADMLALRGEAGEILARCSTYTHDGAAYTLTTEKLNEFLISASLMTKQAYRIIAVATRISQYNTLTRIGAAQSGLNFEGFLAIREPILPGVARNIAQCRAAGIKVIMLCDDISDSNRALAEAVGIINRADEAVDARTLATMKIGLFRANLDLYRLYEGLNITQKRLLVKYLRDGGEKVAFLGHELDELILLKECDVAFSQSVTISEKAGRAGVDLTSRRLPIYTKTSAHSAKGGCEALKFESDIIISEADKIGTGGFNAIIRALGCSRVIYQNLFRMMKYLMVSQFARLFVVLFTAICGIVCLSPTQILFSGLVVDMLAVMVVSFERPSRDILQVKTDFESKLKRPLPYVLESIVFGLVWSLSTVILPLISLTPTLGHYIALDAEACSSAAFVGFVLSQLVVLTEMKKERSIFTPNIKLTGVYAISSAVIICFIAACFILPKFGLLFGVVPLDGIGIASAALPPVLMLILFEIYKALRRE